MKLLNEFGITNVTVTGDARFDRVLDVRKQARELPFIKRFLESKEGKRPIVMVAGSSWPQDEAIFIPYFHEHPELSNQEDKTIERMRFTGNISFLSRRC